MQRISLASLGNQGKPRPLFKTLRQVVCFRQMDVSKTRRLQHSRSDRPKGKGCVGPSGIFLERLTKAVVAGTATLATAATVVTLSESRPDELPPNPLWPGGVPQRMVEKYVDHILQESDVNIAALPDVVERQIYISTVRLTLNTVYSYLAELHGAELLGNYQLVLRRLEDEKNDEPSPFQLDLSKDRIGKSVDMEALEAVAHRLLQNKAVNQPLVPDVLERQLYVNCLKLVFTLLDALCATLRMTICGHEIRFQFEPISSSSTHNSIRERAETFSTFLTKERLSAVEDFARKAGAAPEDVCDNMSLLERLLEPGRRDLVAQLHSTLYAIVLGVLEDLLADTTLTFLSDRVHMGIARASNLPPPTVPPVPPLENVSVRPFSDDDKENGGKTLFSAWSMAAVFALGLGAGASIMQAICISSSGRSSK